MAAYTFERKKVRSDEGILGQTSPRHLFAGSWCCIVSHLWLYDDAATRMPCRGPAGSLRLPADIDDDVGLSVVVFFQAGFTGSR